MVVHREPEQHGEQEERQPGLDRVHLRKPKSSLPTPSWNTSTISPYAAPTESRLSAIAFAGTTIERNATVSRMKLKPSTNANTIGSQCCDQLAVVDDLGRLTGDVHGHAGVAESLPAPAPCGAARSRCTDRSSRLSPATSASTTASRPSGAVTQRGVPERAVCGELGRGAGRSPDAPVAPRRRPRRRSAPCRRCRPRAPAPAR